MVSRTLALLVGAHAGGVAAGAEPLDFATALCRRGQDVGIGDRSTVVLGATVEQGSGDLGGRGAGLHRTIVELGDLEVPVATASGDRCAPDRGFKCPVIIQAAEDSLVVADDDPRQPGRRVDLRDDAVVVGGVSPRGCRTGST